MHSQPTKPSFILVFAVLLIFISSCSRHGCTDTDAENFEPKAETDCACCYYAAKGLVWYQKPFADYLQSLGITSLKFYADGVLSGGVSGYWTTSYGTSAPTLAGDGTDYSNYRSGSEIYKVLTTNIGSSKSKKMEVTVLDQNDNLVWKDSVIFIANKVITIQL